DQHHEAEINFHQRRTPQISEEQGMPLQELGHRINQIGKEHGKYEDQNDAPCAIYSCAHHGKEQYGQQDVRCAAFGEGHLLSSLVVPTRETGEGQFFSNPVRVLYLRRKHTERACSHIEFQFRGCRHVGAILTAVFFLASHNAFARRISTLLLTLSIHSSVLASSEPSRVGASEQPLR